MTILNKFLGIKDNKEIKEETEDKEKNNNVVIKEINDNKLINALQKQVVHNKNRNNVETAIRPGDGMGMNSKIEG